MATRPNKNIKRLSTAIRKGLVIAKENGIKVARGDLFRIKNDGSVYCACTFGMAIIGLYGHKNTAWHTEGSAMEAVGMNGTTKNKCVNKALASTKLDTTLVDAILEANDVKKLHPSKIADKLESCKL